MSLVTSGDRGRAVYAALDTYVGSVEVDGAGLYLTNEVFLYRVAGITDSDKGQVVELEDCYSLDVVRVPMRQLHAGALRVVTAAPASG